MFFSRASVFLLLKCVKNIAGAPLIMGSETLAKYHNLTYLSALAVEAVVLWDDVTDRLDADQDLLTSLRVSQQDLDQVSTLQRELEAAMQPAPALPQFDLDRAWEEADAAHAGPRELESVLLPNITSDSGPSAETPGPEGN